MGVGEFFSKINTFFEDKYYGFSDFLSEKGIPIDRYNDFLESKGIPPVWFNIILLIVLIAVIVLIVILLSSVNVNMYVSIVDSDGNPLSSADLILKQNEEIIFEELVTPNKYNFTVKNGSTIAVNAIISGYTFLGPSTIIIEGKELNLKLTFSKNEKLGNMTLRLVDNIEKTILSDAEVILFSGDKILFQGKSNDKGEINLTNVPITEPLKLKVVLDGYLETSKTIYARDGVSEDVELERKTFNSSEFGTINFTVKSLGQVLSDVKIVVYNAKTNEKIDEIYTDNAGIALINIPKGKVVRYVVSKENFITFDSEESNLNISIVQNSISKEINLLIGGVNLEVTAKNESGKELSNVLIGLYSDNGLLLDVNRTGILGAVTFSGLDVKRGAYISAYTEDNYYPSTMKLDNVNLGKATIVLKQMDQKTNAIVNVFTIDERDTPISSSLQFFYVENENHYPIILPESKTSISGFLTIILEANKRIYAEARSVDLFGAIEENIVLGKNDFDIVMLSKMGAVSLYVYGLDGKLLKNAPLKINSETQVLYDGNTLNGQIEFYPYDLKEVEVSIFHENNYYSKIMVVEPKMEFTLNPLDISTNPRISFLGVYDAFGKKVNGVKTGETYNLKFNVVWPKSQNNGELHVRLGEGYAPANGFGIYGATAYGASTEYGLYYSKNESSSNVKDLQVFGRPGIKNNWVNIYYENPKGSNEINVKVKIDNSISIDKIPLYYRAVSFDNIYHSDPNVEISSNKLERLYATTKQESIFVFENTFECSEIGNLCFSYRFVDEFGKIDNFEASLDQKYALDLEFFSSNDLFTTVKLSSKNILGNLVLNNFTTNLNEFLPEDVSQEELNLDLSLVKGAKSKYRIYFTAKALGVGKINMLIDQMKINKDFTFNIKEKSNMSVNINSNLIELGKPIAFKVSSTSGFISNAKINIYDSENLVNVLVIGDNTLNNGLNGEYIINELPAGIYTYVVSAKNYASVSGSFIVSRLNILSVKKQNDIRIPNGMKQIDYEIDVKNISKVIVSNLGVEILKDDAELFDIQYRFNRSNLNAGQSAKLIVTVFYEDLDVVFGSQNIAITGIINQNETVRTISNLNISANKYLEDSCLTITPGEATTTIYDTASEKQNGEFVLTNNCEYDFPNISTTLINKGTEDLDALVYFTATTVSLNKGDSKTIKYTLTSNQKLTTPIINLDAVVLFDVGYLKKEVPLSIKILNSDTTFIMALQQQQMYMISGQQSIQLLTIKNMGNAPIKNIRISSTPFTAGGLYGADSLYNLNSNLMPQYGTSYLDNSYNSLYNSSYSGYNNQYNNQYNNNSYYNNQYNNSNLGLSPQTYQYLMNTNSYSNNVQIMSNPNVIPQLLPGQTIMVQLFVNAQFSRAANNVSVQSITAIGSNAIDNQQISQTVPLLINLSTQDCFKLNVPLNKISFISNKLGVNLENNSATIKNECIEPIMINVPFSEDIEGNPLEISSESNIIAPMQNVKLKSVFTTNKKMSLSKPISFEAIGQYTGAKYKLNINYEFDIGQSNIGKEKVPVVQKEIPNCDGSGNVKFEMPKISKNVSCSEAYCDGHLASDFIAGKIKAFYDNYNSQVLKYSKNLALTSCNPESLTCGFDYIGVQANQFTLYLMHDNISTDYLKTVIVDKVKAIKGVDIASNKDLDLSSYSVYFNNIFIDPELEGCGKYVIDLKGAFLVRDSTPQTDSINIFVDVIEKESMPHCEDKFENYIMYLPKDIVQKSDSVFGFRYAVMDSDSGLKEFAKEASKAVFGSERIDSSRNYNVLHLAKGNIGNSQMTLSLNNSVVNLVFNNAFDFSKISDKQDALKLVKGLWEGNLGMCYDPQTKSAKVTHLEDASTGKYSITSCGPIYMGLGKQECNFTVDGAKLGNGTLEIIGPGNGYTARIKDKQGNDASSVSFLDNLRKEFVLEIIFTDVDVAKANLAQDKLKILLTANGTEYVGDIKFEECGVIPADYISAALNSDLKNKFYSAQINLGNAKFQEGCDVFKDIQIKNKNLYLKSTLASGEVCVGENIKTTEDIIKSNFGWATLASAGAAFGACVISEAIIGKSKFFGPVGWVSGGIGCALTTGILAGTSYYSYSDMLSGDSFEPEGFLGLWERNSTLENVGDGAAIGSAFGSTFRGSVQALFGHTATPVIVTPTPTPVTPTPVVPVTPTPVSPTTISPAVSDLTSARTALTNQVNLWDAEISRLTPIRNISNPTPAQLVQVSAAQSRINYLELLKLKGDEILGIDNPRITGRPKANLNFVDEIFKTDQKAFFKTFDPTNRRIIETAVKNYDDLVVAGITPTTVTSGTATAPASTTTTPTKPKLMERFKASRVSTFLKGALRGAISGAISGAAYGATFSYMFSNKISQAKSFELIFPDRFIDDTSYTLELSEVGKGQYKAEVKEDKSVSGFCVKEHLDKKYIARDFIIPYSSQSMGITGTTETIGTSNCILRSTELSDIRMKGGSSLSAETIDRILKKNNSPAVGSGIYFVKYGIEYGVDPAFALAFFQQESSFGKAGVARTTKGIGNIVYTSNALPEFKHSTDRAWSGYYTYEASIKGWYNYMTTSKHYFPKGKFTIDEILPIYAPKKENNTTAYIQNVKNMVIKYRAEENNYDVACNSQTTPVATKSNLGSELSKYLIPIAEANTSTNSTSVNKKYYNHSLMQGEYGSIRSNLGFVVLHDGGSWSYCKSNDDCAVNAVLNFWKSKSDVSSHYYIGCSGEIFSLVPEQNVAYHAGCSSNTPGCVPNMNSISIGIDLRDCTFLKTGAPYTSQQHDSLAVLLKNLEQRKLIKEINDYTVVAHAELSGAKNDPLPGFNWSKLGLTHRDYGTKTKFLAMLEQGKVA